MKPSSPKHFSNKNKCASACILISFGFVAGSLWSHITSNARPDKVLQHQNTNSIPVALRTRANGDDSATALDEATALESNNENGLQHSPVAWNPPQTNFSGIIARSFDQWSHPLPCFQPEEDWRHVQNSPADTGFFYVKPYKTGSSTTSGINLRIARNVALRQEADYSICRGKSSHIRI